MTDSTAASPAVRFNVGAALSQPAVWVALIALATFCFHMSGPLGPDVSWLITVSERILAGQVLYVDILEPNPPVAGYLYMPPVLVAHLFGLKAEPFVIVYTLGFGALMTGIAAHVVRETALLKRTELLWPLSFLVVGAAWGEDFGQREHFATMAALPLIACTAMRAAGMKPKTWQWILAGLCGGFILAIKPHFALAIGLPALYAAIRQRSIRPILAAENWLAGSIFLAFLALIWFAFPAFITNMLPPATTVYVPDRREPLVLLNLYVVKCFLVLTAVGLVGFWRKIGSNAFLGGLFVAAIGYLCAYFAQSRGYTYQVLPPITLMTVFLVMAFADGAEAKDRKLVGVLAVLCASVVASVSIVNELFQWKLRTPLYEALEPYGPGLRVANLSPDLTAGSPLHRVLGWELVNSAPALLMSISAHRLRDERNPDPAWMTRIDAVENAERVQLREDMKKRPPDIIVIVTPHGGFDWYKWAEEDPELAAILEGFEAFATVPFGSADYGRLLRRRGLEPAVQPTQL